MPTVNTPLTDIQDRKDVEHLIESFYNKVLKDEIIGFFFTDVKPIDLAEHIPTLTDFWEYQIFSRRVYRGNTYQKHRDIHELARLTPPHFQRWLSLFVHTVEEEFLGPNADLAKTKARAIAEKMSAALARTESAVDTPLNPAEIVQFFQP